MRQIEGAARRKEMKTQLLSTRPQADGKVGRSFVVDKTFLEPRSKNAVASFSKTTEDLF